jgi:hypothetical protein
MTIFLVSPNHSEARKVMGWDDTPCFSEHEIQSKCQNIMTQFENDHGYKCEAYYFQQSIEGILSSFVFQKGLPLVDFNAFRATMEQDPKTITFEEIPRQLLDPITLMYNIRHDVYNYCHAPRTYYGDLVDQAITMVDTITSIVTDLFTELNTVVNSEGENLHNYDSEYSVNLNEKMVKAVVEVETFKVTFTEKIQDLLSEQEQNQLNGESESTDSDPTDLSSFEEELIFSPPKIVDGDEEEDFYGEDTDECNEIDMTGSSFLEQNPITDEEYKEVEAANQAWANSKD